MNERYGFCFYAELFMREEVLDTMGPFLSPLPENKWQGAFSFSDNTLLLEI